MGTRNLTAVFAEGKYKIAQYGQWDGYPEGQGKTVLGFLAGEGNIERLKSALVRCRYLEPGGRDKDFLDEYEKNAPEWSNQPDNRTPEQKRWFASYISRDLGAKILCNVASSDDAEIVLKNSISFAAYSLMCEWAYVIDFDLNTLEVFKRFNKIPLSDEERFKDAIADDEANKNYLPVCLAAKYDLSELPTIEQIVADCCHDDEDD
jgi:hypothetical protein